jgi:hypothetical protein
MTKKTNPRSAEIRASALKDRGIYFKGFELFMESCLLNCE